MYEDLMQDRSSNNSPVNEAYRPEENPADFWNPPVRSIAERMEQSSLCTFDLPAPASEEHDHSKEAVQTLQPGRDWRHKWEESMRNLKPKKEPMPVVFQSVPVCYDIEPQTSRKGEQVGLFLKGLS